MAVYAKTPTGPAVVRTMAARFPGKCCQTDGVECQRETREFAAGELIVFYRANHGGRAVYHPECWAAIEADRSAP